MYDRELAHDCKHKEFIKGANEEGNEGKTGGANKPIIKTIDMRAHGTQKTNTRAMCSHKTKTQAHGQQTIHQPCAKQDTNTQLMRIPISHVFTQDMTT